MQGIPKNYLNALDTCLTLKEPETVKYVAKMTNFGPLKKPLEPPYGPQKNQKQAKFMFIHDGYLG